MLVPVLDVQLIASFRFEIHSDEFVQAMQFTEQTRSIGAVCYYYLEMDTKAIIAGN